MESFGNLEGLVVGPWGDARSWARPASDNKLGAVVSQIRRVLSTTFVRAQSLYLLSRVGYLGSGASAAADRRVVSKRLEVARQRRL